MSVVASTTPGSCFSCFTTAVVQATPQTMPSKKNVTLRSSDSAATVLGVSGGVGFSLHPMLRPSAATAVMHNTVDGKKFIVF